MTNNLSHDDFIKLYKAKKVSAQVNLRSALRLVLRSNLVARKYQLNIKLFLYSWLLCFPAFILFIVLRQWIVLILLFLFIVAVPGALKKSAGQFIVDQALEDIEFYLFVSKNGLMTLTRTN